MATHNDTGHWGEDRAAEYLIERGYQILEKNFKDQHREIDLIVTKDKMLVFVEVKTRSGTGFGLPEEFVNYTKAQLIKKAAENYIYQVDWQHDIRFDIIAILILPNGHMDIRHVEDAFY
ncbi:YraN family protein [Dyadobacter tibetensis]|uniref:YraN family protein n=1 Tax=Dyadobacter tibetensis TaxID=1211851 RepID=UPI000472A156|nr:YraN family protein [Dyadobacter tibetensis]